MARKAFAFIHVNVIPMDEERVLSDQTVIIENARIREIGDAAHVIVPEGAIKIDASDQYMIPAFADMHVHLEGSAWNMMVAADSQFTGTDSEFSQILFPYLANGVTTVQVMSAFPEHITLRDRINRGEFVGPRLILNRMIDGSGKAWPPPICSWVDSAAEAYQSVEDANLIGYDGMKVYSFLNQECYDAIMTKAGELAMPVVGHIPDVLTVETILAAGQRLIAHAEEVMKQAQGDFTAEKIGYFADIVAGSETWITPTLTTTRQILAIFDDLEKELNRPELHRLHPIVLGIWSYLVENIYLKMPSEHRQTIRHGFESFQRPFTKALHDKGSALMTGTDALIPTNIPGYAIHNELWELVEIGLTPFEALRAATTNPMRYLGELDDAGTLAVGKRADFVLLEANPLEIIANSRSIIGVMSGQKWLNLDDIQRGVESL